MTLFNTPEEYEEMFQKLMKQYYELRDSEKYPGQHSEELTRIWKVSRHYCSSILISLLDVSQNLPLKILDNGEKIITHISLHTRKDWDVYGQEYVAFWAEGQTSKDTPTFREPNKYNCLSGTYINISREEAIRIGFEADTSEKNKARFGDERRALEIRVVPIKYTVAETDEYMRSKLMPKGIADEDIKEMLK